MRGAYATERSIAIREHGLTREDTARIDTTRAGDPICAYAGDFALQASMVADERAVLEVPSNIILGEE